MLSSLGATEVALHCCVTVEGSSFSLGTTGVVDGVTEGGESAEGEECSVVGKGAWEFSVSTELAVGILDAEEPVLGVTVFREGLVAYLF